jgi:phosphoribosyl-dephospho-CoA transferase
MTALRRHDLAYLDDAAAIRPAGVSPYPPFIEQWLADWLARGRPLVVARQDSLPTEQIRLGAALPLRLGRAKVACVTDAGRIRTAPALSVEAVLRVLPLREQRAVGRLSEVAQRLGVALGVYGSTAWECLSGEPYRRPDSDVDLICDVGRRDVLLPWLEAMQSAARDMEDHLDGEIRIPDGQAVAWRELARVSFADSDSRVLVKSLYNVGFTSVATLMESLA